MPDPRESLDVVQAMRTICLSVAEEAKTLSADKLRVSVILVYLSDDTAACGVAEAVVRATKKDRPDALSSSTPAAVALLNHHGIVVRELRAAGYEISEPKDLGPGRLPVIFIVGRECIRNSVPIDTEAAAQHDSLMADLDNLPPEAYAACKAALDRAATLSDTARRKTSAMAVCECNDPKACQVIAALARAAGEEVKPEADKALSFIYGHAEITEIARDLGYEVAPVPDPDVGRMRVFFFVRGRCITTDMQVVHPEQVELAEKLDRNRGTAEGLRIFEEKQGLIGRVVAMLQATPGLLETRIVILFASRSTFALKVYRDMTAMPELHDFPKQLRPQGTPVCAMGYDDFMRIVHRHSGDAPRGYEAAKIGPNEVRIAIFVGEGIYFQRTEVIPLSRGGAA